MTRHRKGSFEVRGGKVSGVDPKIVLLEAASGQWEVLRICELENGFYQLGADGVTRKVKAPPVPNVAPPRQHKRKALRRRSPPLRGKRCILTLYGTP
jgi:hypothetical protein